MGNVPSRSWPIKRLPDQFGAPTNAQVGRVQDLSRPHPLNDATSAADILADAVFYVDAQEHAAAGANAKTVLNRGWGGSVLNARCGSTSVPDTNDPRFLAAEPTSYVYLPGVGANGITVAYTSGLTVTGDLTVVVDTASDSWASGIWTWVSQNNGVGTDKNYEFSLNSNGTLRYAFTTTGSGGTTNNSSVAVSMSAGERRFIAVTHDVDNGASGNDVRFWTSPDGSTWTQLGTTQTNAGVVARWASTSAMAIGYEASSGRYPAAKIYRVQVTSGVGSGGAPGGTTVLDVDTSVLTTGSATSFQAATGQTVTINRSTSGRKTVVVPNRDRSGGCWLFGTDDILQIVSTGATMLDTPINDEFTAFITFRQWTTIPTGHFMGKKGDLSGAGVGWSFYSFSGNWRFLLGGPIQNDRTITPTYATTQTHFVGITNNPRATTYDDLSTNTAVIPLANPARFTIGGTFNFITGGITNFQDMELMSIAIFKRRLTANERATLTTAFQGRYA